MFLEADLDVEECLSLRFWEEKEYLWERLRGKRDLLWEDLWLKSLREENALEEIEEAIDWVGKVGFDERRREV